MKRSIHDRAESLYSNKDWRDGINEAAGRKLSVKEMYQRALDQAEDEDEDDGVNCFEER